MFQAVHIRRYTSRTVHLPHQVAHYVGVLARAEEADLRLDLSELVIVLIVEGDDLAGRIRRDTYERDRKV